MHRFYYAHADFSQSSITINDPHEVHHIKDVLRLKKGAVVQVFNAQGQEADVVLESMEDRRIQGEVRAVRQVNSTGAKIILACAPPKKGKFELIIEKATELGVDEIIPLKTKRTEVIFEGQRMAAKLSRFQAVAQNAVKQSKQARVPLIKPMTTLGDVLKNLPPGCVALFPSLHDHPQHMREVLLKADKTKAVVIFIGPEGDFTPDEVKLAIDHGCLPVSLGSTVLKVETAAIAAVALVRFLHRD